MGLVAPADAPRREFAALIARSRGAFVGLGLFSAVSNILMLTGSMFMLEVYDRVLPSRSIPTLVGLAVLAATLFAFQGALDFVRSRLLIRVGVSLDEAWSDRVIRGVLRLPLVSGARSDGLQPIRDLDSVRSFLSGSGPIGFFDLPWIPFYLAICFLFHTLIGLTALAGALILLALTVATEVFTQQPIREAAGSGTNRFRLADTGRRNAEALAAMGIGAHLEKRWLAVNDDYLRSQARASDVAGGFGAVARVLRIVMQSAVLGVGAYLVIRQEASAGVIIASSIIAGRALAPIDVTIANWKSFTAARHSWRRIVILGQALNEAPAALRLPAPRERLSVENLSAAAPGTQRLVLQDVSFALRRGDGLGIIGPSGAGKSSLARLLVGAWRPARGAVRLDGAELAQFSPADLGRHIGYLPQDVELVDGTIAENIGRFDPEASDEAIVAAAKAARVHDLIVKLPQGYQTALGENGSVLSAGQRQRIGLARALYGDPFLLVLDEPNSNLDSEGAEALGEAIAAARARGAIVIVVAHRPSALAGMDLVLALAQGRLQSFGPKDDVLAKVLRREGPVPVTLKLASDSERGVR